MEKVSGVMREIELSLDEVRAIFLKESKRRKAELEKQIRKERLLKKQTQAQAEQVTMFDQSNFEKNVTELLNKVTSPALERRQELTLHVCRKQKSYAERRQELTIVLGQNKKGRERMAKNNRRSLSVVINRRTAEQIQVVNDMIELGIL